MNYELGAKVKRPHLKAVAAKYQGNNRSYNRMVLLWAGILRRAAQKNGTIGSAIDRYQAKVGIHPPSDFRFVLIGQYSPSLSVRELMAGCKRAKKEVQARDFWCEDCEYRTHLNTATHCKLCGKELRLK